MPTIRDQIAYHKGIIEQQEQLLEKLYKRQEAARSRLKFKCICGSSHQIRECDAIQTMYLVKGLGYEDDSEEWGSLMIICPVSGKLNRVYIPADYDLDWQDRHHYKNDACAQFRRMYTPLFKSCTQSSKSVQFYNNMYFDNNRKKFGLVEKSERKVR